MYAKPEALIGQELAGYHIEAVLGRGGMGIVYRAERLSLGRTEALKIVDPTLIQDQRFLQRFRAEARALARLNHPYIVTVYDLRETPAGLCIAMEYVEGTTLFDRLKLGAMPWQEALPLMRQLLSALGSAHRAHILHRDIKPRNIMLTPRGEVRIMDFGLAKVVYEEDDSTATDAKAGTLMYMSPEQVNGLRHVDARSDLYSLGMTFYEMLSGRLPFERQASKFTILKSIIETPFPRPRMFGVELPAALVDIVMKALEKRPEDRYQCAEDMLAALDGFERSLGEAPRPLPAQPAAPPPNRRRRMAWVSAVLLCAALGAGYFWLATSQTPLPVAATVDASAPRTVPNMAKNPQERAEADGNEGVHVQGEAAGGAEEPEVVAVPLTGAARFTSEPAGARVLIDGAFVGTTPHTATGLAAGPHRIELVRDGYRPLTTTVDVQPNQTVHVERRLTQRVGTLQVSVRPWGDLYIDDKLVQKEIDARVSLPLAAGKHLVAVEHPDFGRWAREIVIPESRTQEAVVDFTRTVRVSVTASDTENRPLTGQIWIDAEPTRYTTPGVVEVSVGLHRIEVRVPGYRPVEMPPVVLYDTEPRVESKHVLRRR